MFNDERQNKILELIDSVGRVEVTSLSESLNVSLDTVRRDLKKLEKEGLLKRTHGGAVRLKPIGDAFDYATRKRIHSKEKMQIAKIAASYIKDHDSILIDGSTTISALLPYLVEKHGLSVFTNNVQVACELQKINASIKIFMIGGILDEEHGSAISHDTVAYIDKLNVNKVFIGSCSISLKRGLSASEVEDASVKKAMLKAGEEIFILADHTKFTRESMVHIADLEPTYKIVSDKGLVEMYEDVYLELLKKKLDVTIAD